MLTLISFICLTIFCKGLRAELIAYDCADPDAEISKISLLDVQPCRDPMKDSNDTQVKIQLVQERHYSEIHVFNCLVTVQQLIEHCGMHSHTSAVAGGLARYVHLVKGERCLEAHQFRRLDLTGLGAGIVSGLILNGTTEVSTTISGHIDTNGRCSGTKYTHQGVTYDDVIVSAAITIKLSDYLTIADIEENTVRLRSGTVCSYTETYCFDDLAGEVTWKTSTNDRCSVNGIDVLYEGSATVLTINNSTKYVVIEAQETVFALSLIRQELLCHQPAWRTEQNRLLIITESSLGFYFRKSRRVNQNTDLMTQVLSKLLFLEIAFKQQAKDLLYNSLLKRCHLREQILRNRIILARENPDVVSGLVKEASGHMGRVMGEVLYVIKCSPRVVNYRKTDLCYQELPIIYKNTSKFMAPITRIIQDHGTQVDCEKQLPVMLHLEGKWLELDPDLRRTQSNPTVLDANDPGETIPTIKITPISSHGVYTQQDMTAFQRTLLFPNEKRAITNIMTRRVIGIETDGQDLHIPNVFSKKEFVKMAWGAASEVWGFLSYTGNLFSVFMLLYTLYNVLRYVCSVVINIFSLKRATQDQPRRKWFLLASLWDAMTTRYLVNVMQQRTGTTNNTNEVSTAEMSGLLPTSTDHTNFQRVLIHPPAYHLEPPANVSPLRQPVVP